jgi:hypothetical protein
VRVCTRCGGEKPQEAFRRLRQGGRHTWCKHCESEASTERYALYRAERRPAAECRTTAENIDHVIAHHGRLFDGEGAAALVRARDVLREAARLAEPKGVAS